MLPSYFDYILVHLRQKVRLGPELSPKFLSTLGPNPARNALYPTYNSGRVVGDNVSNLIGPKFEPQIFRYRKERVTARPFLI